MYYTHEKGITQVHGKVYQQLGMEITMIKHLK